MSRSTISTFQLFALFAEEESARIYLEARLWPNGPICPDCKSDDRVSALGTCATRKAGFYRCNACQFDFTLRTGTIFGRSHIPLHKLVYAMYLLVTARKGISSLQLAKEIGVTKKTAWFILDRLREACSSRIVRGCDRWQTSQLREALRMSAPHRADCRCRLCIAESLRINIEHAARVDAELEPLCPDSPDGNHHVAPIGSDEEWMPSKAPCYYCGDKQAG